MSNTNTAKPRRDVYAEITARILETLEAGTIPWRQTWNGGAAGAPRSVNTNKFYRGMNVTLLMMAQQAGGYSSNYWLTFKQAKTLGGSVMKGEKGTGIVFWSPIQKKENGKVVIGKNGKPEMIFFLRCYTVFNLEQTEDVKLPAGRIVEAPEPREDDGEAVEADALFTAYTGREGIAVQRGGGRAYYTPNTDSITLPPADSFESASADAATAFHEAVHSTGTEKRLNRPGIAEFDHFGSHQYADEELVAEFGASFLCSMTGVSRDAQVENSAAYIASWKKRCQEDPKILIYAAQRAQKAADLIMGTTFEDAEE